MNLKSFILIYLIFSLNIIGQTAIGFDFSICQEKYKLDDPGNALEQTIRLVVMPGATFSTKIKKNLILYSGIFIKAQNTVFKFKLTTLVVESFSYLSLRIPIGLAYSIPLRKDFLWLRPFAGGILHITPNLISPAAGSGSLGFPGKTIDYTYRDEYNEHPQCLAQVGLSIVMNVRKHLQISSSFSYVQGFNWVDRETISYVLNSTDSFTAQQTSQGELV